MTGPLDHTPRAYRPPFDVARPDLPHDPDRARWRQARQADRVAALLEALDGIELGAYDRRIVEHLAGSMDTPEFGAIVSWVLRARATPDDALLSVLVDAESLIDDYVAGPGADAVLGRMRSVQRDERPVARMSPASHLRVASRSES